MPLLNNWYEYEYTAATIKQAAQESLSGLQNISEIPTGGTTDQVLTKNSGTDGDVSWQTPSAAGGGLVSADIDTLAELNAIVTDATLVDASHTHTATDITDFASGVTNNVSVAANTAKVSFTDAPSNGSEYVRKDGDWAVASGGGGGINEYMYPVWAEENSTLGAATYEWAFGNGANTPSDGGMTVYVPTGWTCEVVAMSLRVGGGTATVELVKNGTLQGSNCNVVLSSGQSATNDSFTAISLANNDYINFRTTSASGTSAPCVVTAWIKMTET